MLDTVRNTQLGSPHQRLYVAEEAPRRTHGPRPTSPDDSDDRINTFQYLPSIIRGAVGVLPAPWPGELARLTPVAAGQAVPVDVQAAPAGTPLRAGGPIQHVFFVGKENRTYDQVLGDDGRGDSDPSLALFGPRVTPNQHAFARRFPLLDHVYANSEASVDGHFWTAAGYVPDYVHKNWMANYAGRGRPYDFGVYSVIWPQGIAYFNYGEAVAGVVPLPDKDKTQDGNRAQAAVLANSDLGAGQPSSAGAGQCYPNDASIESDAVNYLVLPNDHTVGTTPGKRTPQALVADNDYGPAQVVDAISHSSIWSSSAIFVVEDGSQDGADHVDAHRIPAFVISPYARRGAVVSHRDDQLSVLRSIELILGMSPLGMADAAAARCTTRSRRRRRTASRTP